MIKYNLFDGSEPHSSLCFQNQDRTVGEALTEIVRIFSETHYNYGAWVEDFQLEGANSFVKVGNYGMSGQKWIEVYEGPQHEIMPLAEVCYWFYKSSGEGSKLFKAKILHEQLSRGFQPNFSGSADYRPPHGGYPVLAAIAA